MFALFEKKNPSPTEENPSLSPVYVFQGCKLHILPADVDREWMIYLPIGDDVYEKFLLDPSAADRYIDRVMDYEQYLLDNPEYFPSDKVKESVSPPPSKKFEAVNEVLPLKVVDTLMNFQLVEVEKASDVDVLILVEGDKLTRTERDNRRIAPPVTVYGLSKEFALDATFQTTLTNKNPSKSVQAGLVARSQLWINNPRPGFSYGLKVTS